MERIPRFSERSLYTLTRRAGVLLRRHVLNRFVREKNVRLITMNGRRFKRVTLPDSAVAARVARNFEPFRHLGIFPRIIAVDDRELLVEFVEGRSLPNAPPDASLIDAFVDFFTTLYGVGRRKVDLVESGFAHELRVDLDFLRDVGVLGASVRERLATTLDRVAPREVWVGYDYMDPLFKNFVLDAGGRLIAIDVEDVHADELLGSGVAKALVREMGDCRDALLEGLARRADLDLRPAMSFIELRFIAGWTKRAYLKGRYKLVDASLFDAFVER